MKKPRVSDEELVEIIGTARCGDLPGDVMAVERDLQDARAELREVLALTSLHYPCKTEEQKAQMLWFAQLWDEKYRFGEMFPAKTTPY